jgi:CubicO group peptidase (beta-lactamase class C family)
MAYSNAGPAVAAYIVEKLAGERFEDFVEQNLFAPIGMNTATFFEPPAESAATLYRGDGTQPYPYSHMIYRPSGAVNASAMDMAAYLRFYLHRGMAGETRLLQLSSIARMEVPVTSWAAGAGLKEGYGLGSLRSIEDGFVYHGHDGTVSGGLSQFWYMPDYGAGYFFSINSDADLSSCRVAQSRSDPRDRRHVQRRSFHPAGAAHGLVDNVVSRHHRVRGRFYCRRNRRLASAAREDPGRFSTVLGCRNVRPSARDRISGVFGDHRHTNVVLSRWAPDVFFTSSRVPH